MSGASNRFSGITNNISCNFNKKQRFFGALIGTSLLFITITCLGRAQVGQYASYAKMRRYISLQLGNVGALDEPFSPILGDDLTFAVFIIIDSSYFTSSIENVVKKWSEEEPFMRYCNQSINCDVHMMFYNDDKRTNSSALRESLVRTIKPGHNATVVNDKIHIIRNRPEDARYTTNEMMVTYIAGADYFLVITSEQIVYEGRTGRTMQGLIDQISNENLRDIGTLLFTKLLPGTPNSNTVTGSFFSKLHIEIFGEPFPFYNIPGIPTGFEWLAKVYPRFMKLSLTLGSKTISLMEANSTTNAFLTPEFKQECNDTLERYFKAVKESGNCLRCGLKKHNKVIAMSLFGSDPRYTYGALRNAQLLPIIFPGWRLWFFTEKEPAEGKRMTPPVPPNIIRIIEELGSEFRYIDAKITGPRLWRYTVLEEMDIEYFTSRDSDSRLTPRDAAVVAEWIKSGKPFHCARDHPNHSFNVINAGLWGGKPRELRKIFNGSLLMDMKKYGMAYIDDTVFLAKDFWPRLKEHHAICHDSFSCNRFPASHPFPVVRIGREHLGQVYDQHTIGRAAEMQTLGNGGTKGCVP